MALTEPIASPPWTTLERVAVTAPHDSPALWRDGDKTLLAWPGEPISPGIRLADAHDPGHVKTLALGRVPRSVHLYSAANGYLQLLWLDQTLPGETHLAGALIASDGSVQREPSVIGAKSVSQYSAVGDDVGNVLVLWTEATDQHALYWQRVDGRGRPAPEIKLAQAAALPAIAVDLKRNFHLAWLEPGANNLWTIHYAFVPATALFNLVAIENTPIGVVETSTTQSVESFVIGVDSGYVYCLWGLETISQMPGAPTGSVAGLRFPIGNNGDVKSFNFDGHGLSIHWPSVPDQPTASLTVGLTTSTWDGTKWHDVPAAAILASGGFSALHPAFDLANTLFTPLIAKVALVTDANGSLAMAWTGLNADGSASVYYAATR